MMKKFNHNNDNNNLSNIIGIVLIITIIFGWSFFFGSDNSNVQVQDERAIANSINKSPNTSQESNQHITAPINTAKIDPAQDITINTDKVTGIISTKGCTINYITLNKYFTHTDHKENVTIFKPSTDENAYFAYFGWRTNNTYHNVPNEHTVWTIEGNKILTIGTPVILTWENNKGLKFKKIISIDSNYLITFTDTVTNNSDQTLSLANFGKISRNKVAEVSSFFILHEGPIGYLNDKLVEIKYEDLEKKREIYNSTGGWQGITDKYWLAALIPTQKSTVEASYEYKLIDNQHVYSTTCAGDNINLNPNTSYSSTFNIFIGPKKLDLLDNYEEKLTIKHFDLAVDFGWFYFITKPIFYLLNMAKDYLGNFGLGILLLTVILKILFLPLANKSYRSMARMKKLQPKIVELREQYKDDKMQMNQALIALYKTEKANPMSGCLPMLVQIPVFFALYKVLFVSIEMRQAPFWGWISDLSAPDPTTIFNLFGLIPWMPPSFLQIGAWPLIMGVTMIMQQRLNPAPADPIQAKMFMLMPIFFTFMLASFPSGLVIYWAWNNVLTIGQQWYIMHIANK